MQEGDVQRTFSFVLIKINQSSSNTGPIYHKIELSPQLLTSMLPNILLRFSCAFHCIGALIFNFFFPFLILPSFFLMFFLIWRYTKTRNHKASSSFKLMKKCYNWLYLSDSPDFCFTIFLLRVYQINLNSNSEQFSLSHACSRSCSIFWWAHCQILYSADRHPCGSLFKHN